MKRAGTARSVIIVDVGLAGICTLAHRHGSMPTLGRPGGKITPSEIESEGSFSTLSPFDVPVHKTKLPTMYYLYAYPC